jgi:alpha-mannosidase
MELKKFKEIKAASKNYYGERFCTQFEYGVNLSESRNNFLHDTLSSVLDVAYADYKKEGTIGKTALDKAENAFKAVSAFAKETEVLCVAHAHIDMNWMWGYDETVNITLSTLRTMLDLMKEYKDFKFSQSQASVYEIVEKFDPAMLAEIKKRVKEGRWEVSASTWVENDKNLPDGESQLRHYLYAKNYLSGLFGIPMDSLNLDFEPDTFGHNVNMPEILSAAGVKYYYHCRGREDVPDIYRWKAPSGKSVLVYREPIWYNDALENRDVMYVPWIAAKYGINKVLKVYGVGNHGGGATRCDLKALADMNAWPLMPKFKFAAYAEYFSYLDGCGQTFGEFSGELNQVFTGCYTSQTRIKRANRRGERFLRETENIGAFITAAGFLDGDAKLLEAAWRRQLFSHFHDIIPGSGVIGTREYALASAQERDALLGVEKARCLNILANNIDTSVFNRLTDGRFSPLSAAGAGFCVGNNLFTENGADGGIRLFMLVNQSSTAGKYIVPLTLWDYECDIGDVEAADGVGNSLRCEAVDTFPQEYFGHKFFRINVEAELPANGYKCIGVYNGGGKLKSVLRLRHPRYDKPYNYVLENEFIRAEFNPQSGALRSLIDKESGEEFLSGEASFRHITEDASKGMTAWVVGRKMTVTPITETVKVVEHAYKPDGLVKNFSYEAAFGTSKLRADFSLKEHSKTLRLDVRCDFRESGTAGQSVPALDFFLPAKGAARYLFDVPLGVIERSPEDIDRCANSFVCADYGKNKLLLLSDGKYGFGNFNGLSVNLIRASVDPDPLPENYIHDIGLGIAVAAAKKIKSVRTEAERFAFAPYAVPIKPAKGTLAPSGTFFTVGGDVFAEAVKCAEDGNGIIFRLTETEGQGGAFSLKLFAPIKRAELCDALERKLGDVNFDGDTLTGKIGRNAVLTIRAVT